MTPITDAAVLPYPTAVNANFQGEELVRAPVSRELETRLAAALAEVAKLERIVLEHAKGNVVFHGQLVGDDTFQIKAENTALKNEMVHLAKDKCRVDFLQTMASTGTAVVRCHSDADNQSQWWSVFGGRKWHSARSLREAVDIASNCKV